MFPPKNGPGILLIDKPEGFTSFDVVAKVRGIARTRKVGHGGTLGSNGHRCIAVVFRRGDQSQRYFTGSNQGI